MWFKVFIVLSFFPLRCLFAQDQRPTDSQWQEANVWLSNTIQWKNDDQVLFFRQMLRNSTNLESNDLTSLPFFHYQLRFGYEKTWNSSWILGAYAQTIFQNKATQGILRPYFGHISKIKSLRITKICMFDALWALRSAIDDQYRIRCRLEATYPLGTHPAVPSLCLGTEWFKTIEKKVEGVDTRTFQQSRSFIGVDIPLGSKAECRVYGMLRGDYYFALAQYNEDGLEILPDRRLNLYTPIIGWQLSYFIGK